MKRLPPLIKWSGSKQSQAIFIASCAPNNFNTYYEPFLGGGAVVGILQPRKAVCSDINNPLIALWKLIKEKPGLVVKNYGENWNELQKEGYKFFYKARDRFNHGESPHDLLFLSRTCVNGLIRYNQQGKFNNSLHYTRKGIHPDRFAKIATDWNQRIKNCVFLTTDYRKATKNARRDDFIYLDPPYFNTRGRYFGTINFEEFLNYLSGLNDKGIKFALSYDGMRADKNYIVEIPKTLYKRHLLVPFGNSTFKKVQDRKVEKVYESLYLNF
ncbi:DNA adenine methylase [Candidatus Giovannonibacteria bacterium RIFCSPHIGHO2_02_43_16]|uniref:Site-specific DNA-methyltransferase (adenine-specific) n=1 Tax=Candidatus Giovannonibacteria bacterium RIFCSPHIGHO2_02_43_16 TaxID=1798331 RepID=A0A1F5WEZ0_9BACT|nr:MAG: DNA adenine methylase [Candidatus Giovannonibacteria bacterium RIFCSPHIGHO2_02_43_16]